MLSLNRLPAACVLGLLPVLLAAELSLPRLFQDGMVLQRGEGTRIWGTVDSGSMVTLRFQDKTYRTDVGDTGEWEITFDQLHPGGPFTLGLSASCGDAVEMAQVYVGDVWVCSGQSNMVLPMDRVRFTYPEEMSAGPRPHIRQFLVPERFDFHGPRTDLESGTWVGCDRESIRDFSAVGYFFAKYIHQAQGVPIGLIKAALGGSPVQSWMSEKALADFPEDLSEARLWADNARVQAALDGNRRRSAEWEALVNEADQGYVDGDYLWADPQTSTDGWEPIQLPGEFNQGSIRPLPGAVWLRKEFQVDGPVGADQARLWLGRIVDADRVFLNGRLIGETTYRFPPRIYDVPEGLLLEGTNTLVVRVVVNGNDGQFITDKPYYMEIGDKRIGLQGTWLARQVTVDRDAPETVFVRWKPMGLYNAMIAPLTKLSVRGVIWYQGESNAANPGPYADLFQTLILDWREKWYRGKDLPFLFVQLANLGPPPEQPPANDNWAALRAAPAEPLQLPKTAMAVAYDVGEWNDIHPLDKKTVGYRLSLGARAIAYGESGLPHRGPQVLEVQPQGGVLRVTFRHTAGGLLHRGEGAVRGFAVAGADGIFHWATGTVSGDTVVVRCPEVPDPLHVRYAWAMNPSGANLVNSAGLPAVPFRSGR